MAIHVGDTGLELVVAAIDEEGDPINIGAAAKTIKLTKPDGTDTSRTAVNDTDGSDGLMRYNTLAADLDQAGNWQIQGFASFSGTPEFHTDVFTFRVKPNLS
jgi:hypothetical protein